MTLSAKQVLHINGFTASQVLICTSSQGMMVEKLDVSGNFQHKCFCDLYSYENMVKVKATALFGCQEQHLFQSFSVEFPPLAARAVVCMDPATGLIAWVSSTAVRGDHPSCWETFVTCSAASVNMHEGNRGDIASEMLLLRCCFYCNVIRIFSFGLCSLLSYVRQQWHSENRFNQNWQCFLYLSCVLLFCFVLLCYRRKFSFEKLTTAYEAEYVIKHTLSYIWAGMWLCGMIDGASKYCDWLHEQSDGIWWHYFSTVYRV